MTNPASAPEAPQPPPEQTPEDPKPAPPKERYVEGFPEGKPLSEMSDAERALYWENYARKHENTVKGFKGLTPQQVADMQAELQEARDAKLSADDKALKVVRDEAAKQARAEAEAEYLPQIRAAQVQSIASGVVSGDRLSAFMELVDTTKLLDESGAVSEEKVMGYLTAMYGTQQVPPAGPRWQNFGQYSPPPPPQKAGAGGMAEAQKRFGSKT